nr:immunoglobulin light chain junction region [Macaca mulatta]
DLYCQSYDSSGYVLF